MGPHRTTSSAQRTRPAATPGSFTSTQASAGAADATVRDAQPSAHEEAEAAGRRGSRVAVWALGHTLSLRSDAGSFSSPDSARATASPARLPVRKPPAALAYVAGRAGRPLRSACLAVPDAPARRDTPGLPNFSVTENRL